MVGALLSVPTFWACEDRDEPIPEVVIPEEPAVPEPMDYDSWFDLPAEERWGIRWMLGDDMTMRGPGEYEFNVGAEGDEFTFWFPDCDFSLIWADFDGIVQYEKDDLLNSYYYHYGIMVDPDLCQGVVLEKADDNCVRFTVKPNEYSVSRRYVLCFHSKNGKGIVRFVFNQAQGSGAADGIDNGAELCWKSGSESFICWPEDWIYEENLDVRSDCRRISVFPSASGATFAVKCLNSENLTISSTKDELRDNPHRVEYKGISVTTRNDSLYFNLPPNTSGDKKKLLFKVSDGTRAMNFCICQRYEGYKWQDRIYPADPEWELVNDGSRWTGGITPNYAIRVPPRGCVMTIRPVRHDIVLAKTVEVDGTSYKSKNKMFISWDSWDIPVSDTVAGVHHHDSWAAIDCIFTMNISGRERVVKVNVEFWSNVYDDLIGGWLISDLAACGQIIFVQPPYQPGIDDE